VQVECPGHSYVQSLHPSFGGYCPIHEFDWTECCNCCTERREELRRIDHLYRRYWQQEGYSWADRGRTR